MTEQELYDTVFGRVCDSKDAHYAATAAWFKVLFEQPKMTEEEKNRRRAEMVPPIYEVEAYAELAKDVEIRKYDDDRNRNRVTSTIRIPAGTPVRIVMASRLGDLGVTRNLNTQNGYETRVMPGDGYLTNCRLSRA